MNTEHTPRPWRWEINEKSKVVQLCGGRPKYDLTVMDFERWGMGGAIPRLRDMGDHGILTRCLKWAKKVLGREHHAHWFKSLDHPDAHLIAAAPDLLEALEKILEYTDEMDGHEDWPPLRKAAEAAIAKARGKEGV